MNWQNGQIKIHKAKVAEVGSPGDGSEVQPGLRTTFQEHPAVITSEGLLVLEELQPAGKKPMPGPVFLRGARDWI
jgi:methionyl-tRNA formyltransferase